MNMNDLEDWLFSKFGFQLWDRSMYAIGKIPDDIRWYIIVIVVLSAIAVSVIGAMIPAFQAARKKCVEVLQVDQL